MKQHATRIAFTCAVCGAAFTLLACQMHNGRGRYCSRACQGKAKRHGSTLFCAWCDAPFYRRFGEQDIGVAVNQFCSIPCYTEWRANKRTSYPKDGIRHKHRVVAEAILRRPLLPPEVVHHIDEDRQNCLPNNLAVFPSQSFHARCHFGTMSGSELDQYRLTTLASSEATP